jgi:hypothetical protein
MRAHVQRSSGREPAPRPAQRHRQAHEESCCRSHRHSPNGTGTPSGEGGGGGAAPPHATRTNTPQGFQSNDGFNTTANHFGGRLHSALVGAKGWPAAQARKRWLQAANGEWARQRDRVGLGTAAWHGRTLGSAAANTTHYTALHWQTNAESWQRLGTAPGVARRRKHAALCRQVAASPTQAPPPAPPPTPNTHPPTHPPPRPPHMHTCEVLGPPQNERYRTGLMQAAPPPSAHMYCGRGQTTGHSGVRTEQDCDAGDIPPHKIARHA